MGKMRARRLKMCKRERERKSRRKQIRRSGREEQGKTLGEREKMGEMKAKE